MGFELEVHVCHMCPAGRGLLALTTRCFVTATAAPLGKANQAGGDMETSVRQKPR